VWAELVGSEASGTPIFRPIVIKATPLFYADFTQAQNQCGWFSRKNLTQGRKTQAVSNRKTQDVSRVDEALTRNYIKVTSKIQIVGFVRGLRVASWQTFLRQEKYSYLSFSF
jgi:hypothetical protein